MIISCMVHDDVKRIVYPMPIDSDMIIKIAKPVKLYNQFGYWECGQVWLNNKRYYFVQVGPEFDQLNELLKNRA